jgi:hypothetical protein
MKRPSIEQLLQNDFRFLIEEAAFVVVESDASHATLECDDFSIVLRWDKDGCFSAVTWRKDRLDRFYPLVDYLDYFDKRHTYHVCEMPPPHEQAARLRFHLPQIVSMLRAEDDSADWRGFDSFHQLN